MGCQIQAVLSTMLFAQLNGLTYVHTPFRKVGQRVEYMAKGQTLPDWEQRWENFLNLGEGEMHISDIGQQKLKHHNIKPLAMQYAFPRNTLYTVQHCNRYANTYADRYLDIRPRLREKYFSSSKQGFSVFGDSNKLNIAVHVRRGDIRSSGKKSRRYTDNEKIMRTLDSVIGVLDRMGLESDIHLFSLGDLFPSEIWMISADSRI